MTAVQGAAHPLAPVLAPKPTPWRHWRALAAPALPVAVALWLSVPALQPARQVVQGSVARANVCLGVCAEVLHIGGLRLGCKADFLGAPYTCRDRLLQPGLATATYARLPSLAGLAGSAPTAGTLLRLERDGQTVYAKSIASHVWQALYGGWVFHAVYWPVVGVLAWCWPGSWLMRKVGGKFGRKVQKLQKHQAAP